ncbi:2016_t:CDS:2, partial [Racocetra persica]
KKNKDILTEDGNFDQTKLVDLREKAKEANKKTGLEDGTMPYGEFEIINDEEVVLDIGHYSKPGVNFKTFRKGENTYNIVQSAEGGHEFESLFSSKKTLILEKTIEDDLKEAKAYVLDNLNRLKGILISNKDPNNNTLATPKQLIEYFDIVNKAIRNVENQLDLSYAKTAEISRLHPDILADGFNWKNGIKNKTNIDGLRDFSLYSSDAICDLAKKRALNDLTKLKGNLKDEEVNAAVNKVKRDTIPEGEIRDAIIELKVEAMETERDDWKARVKEVIGEAKETVLKYQKDLTTAKAEALTALQNQQGDVDDANINNQIRAIETLKGQEKEIELNEAKKNILTGLENLQDATITDADINRGISRNSNENITGTDNWKNDLKSAKQKALDDLKKLKENLNDGDINDAAEKIQADILPADTNNEIKSTEELTRYVHVITDAISKVKGTTDIKNAKIHAANRLGIFKGTLNDNDITVAANEIEPNSTSRAIWTQKLQANDSIITNAEQLSHYVKIITRAINKLNTDHDLKQAKVQTRVALQNLIQTSGLTDDQINAKIVEFSPGIPAGNTNWHDKLKENDTTLTDAKALAKHVTLLTRSITASKGADATTELNQVKGERNNLEGQVKLVRSELSIGTDVTDVVNNKLTAADLADYKTAKTNLTTRKNEIKHAIDNNTIPNN